jgi:hypothetical protein
MKEFFLNKAEGEKTNFANFHKAWNEMPEGWIKLTMKSARKRSSPQNRYYWGVVMTLAKQGFRDIGYDEIRYEEQVHEIFKNLFLKRHFENHESLVMEYVASTADLSRQEFIDYLEAIIKFCAENLSVSIPPPGVQTEMPYEVGYVAQPIENTNAILITK